MATINNWYVITGAPHSGKSAMIELLRARGYETIDEAARIYIDREMAGGKTLEDIRGDELYFQRQVLAMKIELEKKLPREQIIFWDRAIPDSDAYYRLKGAKLDEISAGIVKNCCYKKVFLLDYLPFKKDYARTESEAEQIKLHQLLEESYKKINAVIVKVPKVESKEARLNFILNNL